MSIEPVASRLLKPDSSVLLLIDVQEKFEPIIEHYDRLIQKCSIVIQACNRLQIPVIVSEQYPKGLGYTVEGLKKLLPDDVMLFEKVDFGCGRSPELKTMLARLNRRQILVCGVEAHVCVNQTVHQLLEDAYQVHLLQDAIEARYKTNYKAAMAKMQQSGAIPSSVEMAVFELLASASHPDFKALLALIK